MKIVIWVLIESRPIIKKTVKKLAHFQISNSRNNKMRTPKLELTKIGMEGYGSFSSRNLGKIL